MKTVFFYLTFFFGVVYVLFIATVFGRFKRMPTRTKLSISVIVFAGVALVLILWFAYKNPRNLNGKFVDATTRSPVDNQCVNISVSFDKEKVFIFTKTLELKLTKDLTLPPNSMFSMIRAETRVNDLQKIRALNTQHNVFLDLDTVGKVCK